MTPNEGDKMQSKKTILALAEALHYDLICITELMDSTIAVRQMGEGKVRDDSLAYLLERIEEIRDRLGGLVENIISGSLEIR